MKGLSQPLKIFIKYLPGTEGEVFGDLMVYMSKKVDKPDENKCDKSFAKPAVISVDSPDPLFGYEYLYLKMVSTYGCRMAIRVVFPKEDMKDRKKDQN
jgi:hypothetical protein